MCIFYKSIDIRLCRAQPFYVWYFQTTKINPYSDIMSDQLFMADIIAIGAPFPALEGPNILKIFNIGFPFSLIPSFV